MDFAKKLLEKYGWADGKGLGKHENGISQPLKPKLKRSAAGIGYDAAADFTQHWWSALYDKAANNVEVEEKNGKTKQIKTKDNDEFEITSSTWKIHKKKKKDDEPSEEEYSDFFVRTDILTGGEVKSKKESDSEDEPKDPMKLTDEELFAACEGRTAHKGARHGLKALGKLARIEQQEQMLLKQARFKGYSHAKNVNSNDDTEVFEESNLNTDCDSIVVTKNKKKKKRCNSFTRNMEALDNVSENIEDTKVDKKEKKSKQKKKTYLKEENMIESNLNEEMHRTKPNKVNAEEEDKIKIKKKKRKNLDREDSDNNYHSVSRSKKQK